MIRSLIGERPCKHSDLLVAAVQGSAQQQTAQGILHITHLAEVKLYDSKPDAGKHSRASCDTVTDRQP